MSTSLLYHAFGIVGYIDSCTHYIAGSIFVVIEEEHCRYGYSVCFNREVTCQGKPVYVDLAIQRMSCSKCAVVRQVKGRFAEAHKSYTRAFERLVLDLSRQMTIQVVATCLGVGWDLIKAIQIDNLQGRYERIKKRGVFSSGSISASHNILNNRISTARTSAISKGTPRFFMLSSSD